MSTCRTTLNAMIFAALLIILTDYLLISYLQHSKSILTSTFTASSISNIENTENNHHITIDETKRRKHLSILNDTERLKYYMGKWYNNSLDVIGTDYLYEYNWGKRVKWSIFNKSSYNYSLSKDEFGDFFEFLNLSKEHSFECKEDLNKYAFMVWGDVTSQVWTVPIFVRARKAGNDYPIPLQVYKYDRHWGHALQLQNNEIEDPVWNEKSDKAIWRGAATGAYEDLPNMVRLQVVEQYFNHSADEIDVGFVEHNLCKWIDEWPNCTIFVDLSKDPVRKEDMLKNKYLISLEGNDIASNLRWLLYSNSCPIMPIPTCESWAMEGLLKPYVHFVPISFDNATRKWNLEEQLKFCFDNDDLCNEIAQNGKKFIVENKFLDIKHELHLQQRILDLYCQQYNIL